MVWWSFEQWVIVIGLLIAFFGAVVPVAVELVRRHRISKTTPSTNNPHTVEIEERFLDHLTKQIQDQDEEILSLKQTILELRKQKTRVYAERDAAFLLLASAGIPLPGKE